MKRCYGKSGWCSACNQWQIIIIVILFLSLSTYGIFKLTQDPYRTIMGPLCDLPQPLVEPRTYHYSAWDSLPATPDSGWIRLYVSPMTAIREPMDTIELILDWEAE